MTKREIDKYITDNYKDLLIYIKKMIYRQRLDEKPEYFMSMLYLNLIQKKDTFNDATHLKKYISHFIYNNAMWYNSPVRELDNKHRRNRLTEYNPIDHEEEDSSVEELEDRLFQEFELDEHNGINELYYQQLTNLELKRAWEIVFVHKQSSTRKFGAYVGKSKSVGSRYINMLKADMAQFYIMYKEQHNKNNKL